jgi:putative membrane protein
MNSRLTERDKQQISLAIENVEQRSSGELVAVIAERSDEYRYIPVLWAAVIALALPGLWLLLQRGWGSFSLTMYLFQVMVFVVLAVFFRWPTIRRHLIPRAVKQRRAALLARQEFLTLGLHNTRNRAGVLIFVSVLEHHVEIIADSGINEKIAPGEWQDIVDDFIARVREDRFAEGFLAAIERCGKLLEAHFPHDPSETDELPNHLIEI